MIRHNFDEASNLAFAFVEFTAVCKIYLFMIQFMMMMMNYCLEINLGMVPDIQNTEYLDQI